MFMSLGRVRSRTKQAHRILHLKFLSNYFISYLHLNTPWERNPELKSAVGVQESVFYGILDFICQDVIVSGVV